MFFWLLCTQFYTPIFGLFYTQYSLLITIIHCCWYITIMLYIYIYIFIPTLYPSALIHTYIYIHHHYTNCIPGPMFDIILCLCIHIHIYIYVYIYISPLLLVYHNILYIYIYYIYIYYMEVSYVMGGPKKSASVAAFTSTAVPVLFHAMVTSEVSPWGNPRKMI